MVGHLFSGSYFVIALITSFFFWQCRGSRAGILPQSILKLIFLNLTLAFDLFTNQKSIY